VNTEKMGTLEDEAAHNPKTSRPFSVTLLTLGVLIVAVMNLTRLARGAALWDFLAEILPLSPMYFVLTGLVWSLTGVALMWGLWRGASWTPRLTLLAALAYSVYYWIDRLFLASSARMINWPFAAGVNLLLLVWLLWIFRRPATKAFFR
jgi:hypothetical protein